MTILGKLPKLLPAPRARGTAGLLAAAEAMLGVALPPDYHAFIEMYGAGRIDGFLDVLDWSDAEHGYPEAKRALWLLHLTRRNMMIPGVAALGQGNSVPYALFPEPGGLLPWGVTTTGDTLHWVTAGKPEKWSVVAESRSYRYVRFAGSMSSFIAGLLDGSLPWEAYTAALGAKVKGHSFAPVAASSGKKAAPAKKAAVKKTGGRR